MTHVWVFSVERGGHDAVNAVFGTAAAAASYVEEGYGMRPVIGDEDDYWSGEDDRSRRLTVRRWVVQGGLSESGR